jgi:hypothetical protein
VQVWDEAVASYAGENPPFRARRQTPGAKIGQDRAMKDAEPEYEKCRGNDLDAILAAGIFGSASRCSCVCFGTRWRRADRKQRQIQAKAEKAETMKKKKNPC